MAEAKILMLHKPERCGDCPFFGTDRVAPDLISTVCKLLDVIVVKDTKSTEACPLVDIKEIKNNV